MLREKDVEIKKLKKFNDEIDSSGANGIQNEAVAMKIVELSKKIRDLNAEGKDKDSILKILLLDRIFFAVEKERNKSKQAQLKLKSMELASKSKLPLFLLE